jgi:iron complex outermembrane receptor protein
MSYSALDQDGFRDHGTESSRSFYGNYGFRHDENWETRLHVTRQHSDLLLPGSLTKAQVEDDPTQANGFWASRNAARNFDVTRVDLQTTRHLDSDSKVDFGLSFQELSMGHPLPFGGSGGSITETERDDMGANFRYQTITDWFGSENEIYTGVFHGSGTDESDRFNQSDGVLNRARESDSTTTSYYFEDRVRLSDSLRLIAGAALVSADRERTTLGSGTSEDSYSQLNPKLGFLLDSSDNHQYFGSVSSSFEPPTEGNIEDSSGNLEAQSAWTLELGSRGSNGRTTWSGAVYFSQVDNELLTVEVPVGSGLSETSNADSTIHSGIELGVGHDIPSGDNNIHLSGIFNFSKFEFDNDSLWGDNAIPGIPQESLRVEAKYEFANGVYVGLNAHHVASWDVDFANSFEADSFTVLGARAGYNAGGDYNIFIDARNLENKHYASNSGIATDVGGADSGLFNPGSPLAIFFGIEMSL